MKIFKPHFWYNKSQRNGVFFLLMIIVLLQAIYSFVDFTKEIVVLSENEVQDLQSQIDSLKKVEIEKRKPKTYPFNPNYLSDAKASQLGMSIQEIDRLFGFRKQGKFINSSNQFQKVTQVSDSLLNKLAPNFKFPDWVVKQNKTKQLEKISKQPSTIRISTTDINLASLDDLQTIKGVNAYISQRIIKYRVRIQGFTYKSQLEEVWKLDKKLVTRIFNVFSIIKKPVIDKVNVNTASFKEVLSNPYIDYNLCKMIFELRDEVAELQSIEELKNIQGFPLDKYDRIVLYLDAK